MQTHNLAPNLLQEDLSEGTKKHNTSITSIESYKAIDDTGQRLQEKKIVIDAITQYQPVTSRMLSTITGIERTNITRSLYDLVHDAPSLIKEAFIDKCAVTHKRVKYYTTLEWRQIHLF